MGVLSILLFIVVAVIYVVTDDTKNYSKHLCDNCGDTLNSINEYINERCSECTDYFNKNEKQ